MLDFGTGAVLGDPMRLQQIVWNMLSNAIKFTPKKAAACRCQLQRINSHAEITISDTGPGIDEAFLPFVFERFRQADSTRRKKFGGLGLGLSIVRHLVELHGGTVEAANRVDGSGAVFTVKLPILAIRKLRMRSPGKRTKNAPAETPSRIDSLPSLAGIKVLAVDDEPDARQLLTELFARSGADIKTCGSVADAVKDA